MNARPLSLTVLLAVLSPLVLPACGGKDGADSKSATADVSYDDAIALLPGSAIGAGTIDARSFFGSQTFGADLAKIVEKYMPLGTESGFQASRDVDRVTFATYSFQGVDVAAIVIGRFDQAKIKSMATSGTPTKAGVPLVVSQYTNHDVYTVNNIGFTLLSDTRAIVGTESGIRRVLDRIKDKRVKRDIAAWMITTMETPGAAVAVAGDFATNPIPPDMIAQVPLAILAAPLKGLKATRVVAQFKDGVTVAGSLTYPDADTANTASGSVKQVAQLSNWLTVVGVKVNNLDVKVDKSDVQFSLSVDDQSLRPLLQMVPSLVGK